MRAGGDGRSTTHTNARSPRVGLLSVAELAVEAAHKGQLLRSRQLGVLASATLRGGATPSPIGPTFEQFPANREFIREISKSNSFPRSVKNQAKIRNSTLTLVTSTPLSAANSRFTRSTKLSVCPPP